VGELCFNPEELKGKKALYGSSDTGGAIFEIFGHQPLFPGGCEGLFPDPVWHCPPVAVPAGGARAVGGNRVGSVGQRGNLEIEGPPGGNRRRHGRATAQALPKSRAGGAKPPGVWGLTVFPRSRGGSCVWGRGRVSVRPDELKGGRPWEAGPFFCLLSAGNLGMFLARSFVTDRPPALIWRRDGAGKLLDPTGGPPHRLACFGPTRI